MVNWLLLLSLSVSLSFASSSFPSLAPVSVELQGASAKCYEWGDIAHSLGQ